MRVLIVDDEPAARRRLEIMLDELDVEVVGQASNGVEALQEIATRRPDVVLLDIAMPEVDGFDVVRHLSDPKPLIIFQTAYDEYALKAFDHEAVDYVVKPVSLDRLELALERARKRVTRDSFPALSAELLDRLRSAVVPTATGRRPRLLVREGSGHRLLPLNKIIRFTAKEGTVRAHAASGTYFADYTLAELDDRGIGAFLRPNRSELVNFDHIHKIETGSDGSTTLVLSDGTTVHVSRRRAAEVKRALQG
jgi:DNA-binding LytR/AlgR family response regulator